MVMFALCSLPPPAPRQRASPASSTYSAAPVADHGGQKVLAGPLVILIWSRLRRLSGRIVRLAARIEAGTPPAKPCRKRATPPPLRLPRGKAWLVRLMRMDAAAGRNCGIC